MDRFYLLFISSAKELSYWSFIIEALGFLDFGLMLLSFSARSSAALKSRVEPSFLRPSVLNFRFSISSSESYFSLRFT